MTLASLHARVEQALRRREAELIELHRALVRLPTVNHGDGRSADETAAARLARDFLARAGIQAEILEPAPGRGNLLASSGAADGPALLLMSHSDVVPAGDEQAWIHPPFGADLDGGRIWGRGAYDCKMLAAAQLFVMAVLAEEGLPRGGRLRLVMAADEEAGGRQGFRWLAEVRPDFLRCDVALCEGGGASLGDWNGESCFTIGAGEKGRCEVQVAFRAPGGHASTPWGRRNPIRDAAEFIRRLGDTPVEVRPASPVFQTVAQWLRLSEPLSPANLDWAIGQIEQRSPALARSLRAQSRLSFAPTIIRGGDKSNSLPDEVVVTCDFRLLPGDDEALVEQVVQRCLEGIEAARVRIDWTSEASHSPLDAGLLARFEAAASRAAGRPMRGAPVWCAGFTDARLVRPLGTPVYGFQFIEPNADPERLGIHCVDESIEVGMLLPCAVALASFILDTL
ncbi:MAG TPA: M20/M25/M40 family metallo-hydrolase [Candidatus Sumerlaeota bacterium]|nr:M20/M25/M40 family metallo-hydrolase [Candidatus Sumerlaeota bacterium]